MRENCKRKIKERAGLQAKEGKQFCNSLLRMLSKLDTMFMLNYWMPKILVFHRDVKDTLLSVKEKILEATTSIQNRQGCVVLSEIQLGIFQSLHKTELIIQSFHFTGAIIYLNEIYREFGQLRKGKGVTISQRNY